MRSRRHARAVASALAFLLTLLASSNALALASDSLSYAPVSHDIPVDVAERTLLVRFADGDVDDTDLETLGGLGVGIEGVTVGRDGLVLVELDERVDPGSLSSRLADESTVEIAVPGATLSVFDDVLMNDDWYLQGHQVWNRYRSANVEVYQRAYLGSQEQYPHALQFEPFWAETAGIAREAVRIAVLDTGFTAPSFDIDEATFLPMGDYTVRNPITGEPTADASDGHGHGTMVATTIAAIAGNGAGVVGAVGTAPVEVLVYKVLRDDGSSRTEGVLDINEAIMDAVDAGARVINCSFGDVAADRNDLGEAFRPAVEYAVEHGVTIVAAAGNDSLDYVVPPAAVPEVIAVGSIDYREGTLSPFSNHGRGLDLVATGEDIPVLTPGSSEVRTAYGTSFSAPLVTGAVAALAAVAPDANARMIETALLAAADPYPSAAAADRTSYGAGKLDLLAAYDALTTGEIDTFSVDRHAGTSRYDTAATVSRTQFPQGATTAVIASGEDWPDALSAGVLAGAVDGPLLLARPGELPGDTARELDRLGATQVFVVGGPAAVADTVLADIASATGAEVTRISGLDRYATAGAVADQVTRHAGEPARVVIASGHDYPDALAAVPAASAAGWPILLTDPTALPDATARAISRASAPAALIVGGSAAVAPDVADSLARKGLDIDRVSGTDRYATARAVADWAVLQGTLSYDALGIATGRSFPDALAGGPFMASLGAPMILADAATGDLSSWLGHCDSVSGLHVFGGASVVDPTLESSIATRLLAR